MKLIHEEALVLLGDLLDPGRKLFQGLVVFRECGFALVRGVERLGSNPGHADLRGLGLVGHALQPVHVGLVAPFVEPTIAPVVHPKIHRHGGGLVGHHIALAAAISAGGSVAADAGVAEGELPVGEVGHGPHLDVVAVEVLLGDAVADHHDDVAVFEEKVGSVSGRGPQRDHRHQNECCLSHSVLPGKGAASGPMRLILPRKVVGLAKGVSRSSHVESTPVATQMADTLTAPCNWLSCGPIRQSGFMQLRQLSRPPRYRQCPLRQTHAR